MIKQIIKILSLLVLCSCSTITVPPEFTYKEIKTQYFDIASWQKITEPKGVYKVYIEGDGYAFNAHGRPTQDPTPKGTIIRELTFGDESPNVIYLARPCQYVKSPICSQRHWTTARFASEVINAEYEAIKSIVGNSPVVLIGFSGGAQVAGLVATAKSGLNVKKIITIAGNLDHLAISPQGLFWGLASALGIAVYTILPATLLPKFPTQALMGVGMLVGGLVTAVLIDMPSIPYRLDFHGIIALILIVLLGTIVAFLLYMQGVADLGSVKASMIACVEPISAAVFSLVFFDTQFEC